MAHSLWQLIRLVDGSWPFRDVIEQCKLRISPQMRGHLLRLSATCLWAIAVATLSETAIAGLVQVSDSINGATGCSYGALTPGGYFQGTAFPVFRLQWRFPARRIRRATRSRRRPCPLRSILAYPGRTANRQPVGGSPFRTQFSPAPSVHTRRTVAAAKQRRPYITNY
jgi:hypothetical protein